MKAKFGMVVVAGSGKIGGHVASRNRGGAYFRTKVTPINPQTSAQTTVRARLSIISAAWKGLTDAQRQAWNAAVSNYASTDIFGDLKNPSGFNLHQKLNNNLASVAQNPIASPPLPEQVSEVGIVSVIPDASGQTIPLVMIGALDAITAVKVFATAPMSPGKTFVKNEFRVVSTLPPEQTTPVALGAAYTAKFGSFVVGQIMYFKLVAVNINTGQQVEGPQYKATVVA